MKHRPGPMPRGGHPAAAAQRDRAALLATGLAHHNAGRLAEAEAVYRQILSAAPDHADALHLLGVLALQVDKPAAAVELIGQAVRHDAGNAVYFSNLGSAFRRLGRLTESADACRRAVALDANFTGGLINLANALMDLNAYGEAADTLQRLIKRDPQSADHRLQLARALILSDRTGEAVDVLQALLSAHPHMTAAYVNLGFALKKLGRIDEAVDIYRRGLALPTRDAGLLNNYGTMLQDRDQLVEAVDCFQQAIGIQPDFADAHVNLCLSLTALNQVDEAITAGRAAIGFKPTGAEAHTALGCALLVKGEMREGWREYEWRFRMNDFTSPRRTFPTPLWDGAPLAGRTLLIHDEQGVGDGIQFVRYAPLIRAQAQAAGGGRVIVECNTQLTRLFHSLPGVDMVAGRFQPLPAFDTHVSLLSLPGLLDTTLDTIPAAIPYLAAEPALSERWEDRLGQDPASAPGIFRVGVVWAGSPTHRNDRNRSLALEALAPLAAIPGVRLVSLQKGPAGARAAAPPPGVPLLDLGAEISDFADTAAILTHLDLLVTVDTSVAHLAGALGRPAWVLIPFCPDWRWMLDREDTPWYPTLRLFRQPVPGQWAPVLERIRDRLAGTVAGRGA